MAAPKARPYVMDVLVVPLTPGIVKNSLSFWQSRRRRTFMNSL